MTLAELRRGSENFRFISMKGIDDEVELLCRRGILHRRAGNRKEQLIGFSHKIWQDFALAYLIALRLMEGSPDILAGRAYNAMIFRDIGYFFSSNEATLSSLLVRRVLETADQFAFAQLASILSHSPVAVEEDALREIGGSLSSQSRLAVHVTVSAAANRALACWPSDPSLLNIRTAVANWCEQIKSRSSNYPLVTQSLADCLMAELSEKEPDRQELDIYPCYLETCIHLHTAKTHRTRQIKFSDAALKRATLQ